MLTYFLCCIQHSFPHDFRSGPSPIDWDPSKWIILILQNVGLVTSLRRAEDKDLLEATRYMQRKEKVALVYLDSDVDSWDGELWDITRVKEFAQTKAGCCLILINGFMVDATPYLGKHVSANIQTISCFAELIMHTNLS